jgi:Zn-dependent peptidase ImmA (M78 family)/transcriptional regulator with XRE-family HTH domain
VREFESPVPADGPEFQAGRLRLARELRGLNQVELATRAGVTSAAISQFEGGTTPPSASTLSALAEALKVPNRFFDLEFSETHEGFFRSLRRTSLRQRRQARALAHIAHDVAVIRATGTGAASVPHQPTLLDADRSTVERIAEDVRREWRMPSGPIDNVVETLEAHGIVVVRLPFSGEDVDAFSLPFADWPVIVLSADKNDRTRSRFDCAHELGHLVMHANQVWGVKEVETQAHEFAAAFLMPEADIAGELPSRADWPVLFELKRKWQVSLAALLMRARRIGTMTEASYLAAVKETSARGWRRVEPIPLGDCELPSAPLSLPAHSTNTLPSDVLAVL